MKKIFTLILLITCLFPLGKTIGSQTLPPFEIKELGRFHTDPANDYGGPYDCNFNSIYGQRPFLDTLLGFPCIAVDSYSLEQAAVDNYFNVDRPLTGITFWGSFLDTADFCTPSMPVHFRIRFYETGQDPTQIPLEQLDLFLTGELFYHHGNPLYRFEASFPDTLEVPQEGLVSVVQVLTLYQEICFFHWIVSAGGDWQSVIYAMMFGEIQEEEMVPVDWAFCLNVASEIPVPTWPLLTGILLILGITCMRYRKYF